MQAVSQWNGDSQPSILATIAARSCRFRHAQEDWVKIPQRITRAPAASAGADCEHKGDVPDNSSVGYWKERQGARA